MSNTPTGARLGQPQRVALQNGKLQFGSYRSSATAAAGTAALRSSSDRALLGSLARYAQRSRSGVCLISFRLQPLALSFLLVLALATCSCRRDMFHQPYSKPLEASDFFQDNHMASRPLPAHTVARGHLDADDALYTGKIGTNLVEAFPVAINRKVLERGRERFEIYCSPCHGRTGEGNGMIVQRGFPAPPSYHIDRLRTAPVGHFYDVITHGYGIMYSYASRVEPADRWAIAAYIRALQKSRNSTLAEVPADQRAQLEGRR